MFAIHRSTSVPRKRFLTVDSTELEPDDNAINGETPLSHDFLTNNEPVGDQQLRG
jgi:hypothetical protein